MMVKLIFLLGLIVAVNLVYHGDARQLGVVTGEEGNDIGNKNGREKVESGGKKAEVNLSEKHSLSPFPFPGRQPIPQLPPFPFPGRQPLPQLPPFPFPFPGRQPIPQLPPFPFPFPGRQPIPQLPPFPFPFPLPPFPTIPKVPPFGVGVTFPPGSGPTFSFPPISSSPPA